VALVTGLLLLPLAHRHAVAADDDQIEPSTFFPLETHWITDLPGAPVAPPAIDDDTAFVPLRNGSLAAVAIEDGTLLWNASGSTSRSPVAGQGIVVVAESDLPLLVGLDLNPANVLRRVATDDLVLTDALWIHGVRLFELVTTEPETPLALYSRYELSAYAHLPCMDDAGRSELLKALESV